MLAQVVIDEWYWLITLVIAAIELLVTYWWVVLLLALWMMVLGLRRQLFQAQWEVWQLSEAIDELRRGAPPAPTDVPHKPSHRQRRRFSAASKKAWHEWSERYS